MTSDRDISCSYCSSIFQVERIYIEHLQNDHGIQKNIDSCLNIAKKKAGLPFKVKQEVIEEITIDDDEKEDEDVSSDIEITHENISLRSFDSIDSVSSVFHPESQDLSAKEISRNIFQRINNLLDDLGSESVPIFSDVESDIDDTEENIDALFESFRDKIRNLVLDQPSSLSKSVTEPPQAEVILGEQKTDSKCPISNNTFATKTENEKHAMPAITKPKVFQTTYLCPLNGCGFSTSKEGMMNYVAARHLGQVHGVQPQDVKKDGKYRWKKIKTQKDEIF